MIEKNLAIDKKAVGLRIKQIRFNKGYTLESFGKLFSVSKNNVLKWEQGQCLPNKKRLPIISEIGDMTVNELLYGKEDLNFDELFKKITTRPKEEIIDLITRLTIATKVNQYKKITEIYTWNGEKYAEIIEDIKDEEGEIVVEDQDLGIEIYNAFNESNELIGDKEAYILNDSFDQYIKNEAKSVENNQKDLETEVQQVIPFGGEARE